MGTVPDLAHLVPLVIQDKTFVDNATIGTKDPTWAWGSVPGTPFTDPVATPVTGDLWFPHVYVSAENPYSLDFMNPYGRWFYGPWFFPPTPVCFSSPDAVPPYCIMNGPVANPYAALPGQFPGTHAIADALAAYKAGTIKHTGCMVHLVPDEAVDAGPVVGQADVPIYPGDTLADLEARMHATEHRLLVAALRQITIHEGHEEVKRKT